MLKIMSILSMLALFGLSGCAGQTKYYEAVNSQNVEIHTINANARADERREDMAHEEKMAKIMEGVMAAVAATPDKTDDVLVPMLFASMEDKRIMAKALTAKSNQAIPFQQIKAPDSFGDTIQKVSGTILGVGGLALGIVQSNNMTDIAVAGINSAGTRNIGSTITTQGDEGVYTPGMPENETPLDTTSTYTDNTTSSLDAQATIDQFISATQ